MFKSVLHIFEFASWKKEKKKAAIEIKFSKLININSIKFRLKL